MRTTIIKNILASLAVSAAVGCSSFLDVNPKGETFDADMFNSGEGYEDAIYGIYSELSVNDALYGGNLVWMPEAMGQNVSAISDYKFGNLAAADWTSSGPASLRSTVWSNAYKVVNHLNNIIQHAEAGGTDEFKHSALYLGESLALRALIHFDLLRLFGAPIWAPEAKKSKAIPYVKEYSFDITPYSSVDEVYDLVIKDLKRAEELMGEDEALVPAVRTNSASGFTDARITHINLYAVQALLARVYWSRKDLDNAAIYAQKVIDSGRFSFRPLSSFVQPDGGTLDLNETIFGFYSIDCQRYSATKYRVSGYSASSSFSLATDWKTLYEEGVGVSSDYRLTSWFDDTTPTLVKTVNVTAAGGSTYVGKSIVGVNILRLPEMYYIMAEYYLASNPSMAAKFYNAVVATRGLEPVATGSLTYDMLFNERRKEFYGEGFTWHEMKREGRDIKLAVGAVLSGSVPDNYTLPVPDAEDEARNNIEI